MSISNEVIEALRQHVVWHAANQVIQGAHYLKGGFGNFFDLQGNRMTTGVLPQRTGSVQMNGNRLVNQHRVPMCFAAESDVPTLGHRACGGRCENLAVSGLTHADSPSARGRTDVIEFADACRSPARFLWPRPRDDFDSGEVVHGECCLGKRHFDCEGFVCWCFWMALGSPTAGLQVGIPSWRRQARTIALSQAIPGDVLYGYRIAHDRHIGIYVGQGEVVHAGGWNIGVVQEPICARQWEDAGQTTGFLRAAGRLIPPEQMEALESALPAGGA